MPEGIQKFLGDGGSMKKCDHDCDQSLIKSSWGSECKMSKNTKFTSSSNS